MDEKLIGLSPSLSAVVPCFRDVRECLDEDKLYHVSIILIDDYKRYPGWYDFHTSRIRPFFVRTWEQALEAVESLYDRYGHEKLIGACELKFIQKAMKDYMNAQHKAKPAIRVVKKTL